MSRTSDLPLFAQPAQERPELSDALTVAFESIPVGGLVTAESLRDRLSLQARHELQFTTRKNVLGQFFMRLARDGKVEHDGWTEAQREDARHRALRRWRKVA